MIIKGYPIKAKTVVYAVGGLLLTILIGWMVYRTFIAPGRVEKAQQVTRANTGEAIGKAQGQTGEKAANTVAANAGRQSRTETTTRENYENITRQPGADDPVSDPVWDAFVRSVCLRSSAAGLSDCKRLSEVHSQGLEEWGSERAPSITQDGWGIGSIW